MMELGVGCFPSLSIIIIHLKQKLYMFRDSFLRSDKCDALRVAAHERLGEVLRILRIILEHYSALQSTELLVAAGSLIHQVKGFKFFFKFKFLPT